jgi:hypothetical protein
MTDEYYIAIFVIKLTLLFISQNILYYYEERSLQKRKRHRRKMKTIHHGCHKVQELGLLSKLSQCQ